MDNNEFDLGCGLSKGEMRNITSTIEVKIGDNALIKLRGAHGFANGTRVCLVKKKDTLLFGATRTIDSEIFVIPEGLLNLGVELEIAIPIRCVLSQFEINNILGIEEGYLEMEAED